MKKPGMKLDRLTISFLALIATFLFLVAYTVGGVLGVPLTSRPDKVTVHMETTGGLFKGSPVTYRGVRVGTISDIVVGKDGPEATITFKNGSKVPARNRALVRSLSPVGEQYLDIWPKADWPEENWGPYLEDGDEINADAVEIPVTVASAARNLDDLLQNVDDKDIKVLMRELNAGVMDSSEDLESLLDSSSELVASLDEAWPRTQELLQNGKTVNQILASHRKDLATFSTSARLLTEWLRQFDPTFQRILKNAPADFETVGLLIDDLGPVLPALLRNLDTTTNILADRDASVRALSYTVPFGLGRLNSVFRGGWAYLSAYVEGQNLCTYRSPASPTSNRREGLYRSGHCGGSPARWRGANHAVPPINR
jgi:phospholipid/cholesterol/gamma-HCH transport system substrate-binding protein